MKAHERGTVLGMYVIERALGEGGMAVVYLARHKILGSLHAVKVLDPALVVNERLRERFLGEGRIQAQVAHPNIARVTDIIAESGTAALIMEFVDGPSLRERIEESGRPATGQELKSIFVPLLDAVEAVHARGIIHRDLKPSNIVVSTDASGVPRPVLLDFGVARVTAEADLEHRQKGSTRAGAQLGTAGYMSPEQIRGVSDLDSRADVFGLGVILYELATGRAPFDSDESEFDTMQRVVEGRFDEPEQISGGAVSNALGAVIRKALAPNRDERYDGCAAFREGLIKSLEPPAIAAAVAPPTDATPGAKESADVLPSPPAAEGSRRRRLVPVLLISTFLLAAAVIGTFAWDGMQLAAAESESRRGAARALDMLRDRQTDSTKNADPAWLDRAVTIARRAVDRSPTAEARTALALLTVYDEGWHLAGKKWDSAQHSRTDAVTSVAVMGEPGGVHAELARATFTGKTCRLRWAADKEPPPSCAEAVDRFDAATRAASEPSHWWLRLEIGYIYGAHLNEGAVSEARAGRLSQSRVLAGKALAACDRAEPEMGRGSANDKALLRTCQRAAGLRGDLARYYRLSRSMRRADESDEMLSSRTVRTLYRRAGLVSCLDLSFTRHPQWDRTFPEIKTKEDVWCAAVGLLALDCPNESAEVARIGGQLASPMDWSKPRDAWSATDIEPCYLTADIVRGK
jgi:hypothetical protein